ncbi:class I SAM-dependent methyltransferase [Dactylosporangium sp. CA-092794]|uniref:class I SAM-dependent methyltransferase n=1 Tax=Dactylosporangium sp. CA-092794 TaxID=3239929 RepID=UPI003D927458
MGGDVWALGDAYEAYVGRWSVRVADRFLEWLAVPARRRWLDVGCGTGALTARISALADPARLAGVDPSAGFLTSARSRVPPGRASFCAADARALPFADHTFDAVVSGLALNFVPDPGRAAAELTRLAAPGGVVAAYVWDYAGGMAMLRYFWDAAATLDPPAADRDEGRRFPLCHPGPLTDLWTAAGLRAVTVREIEIATVFAGFADFWRPFLGGQGPAPGYVASLTEDHRTALRDLLRARLPSGPDGTIPLTARAWAVTGTAPA